jgi:DNA repair ATPase RecN
MSLAVALEKNASSLSDAHLSYKENVVIVNTFVNSVLTSKLPTLHQPPPDWAKFIKAYEEAMANAGDWVNEVMARLLRVPKNVQRYNPEITQLLNDAKVQANALVAEPSDAVALAALERDLAGVTGQLSLVTTFISGAIKAIQEFGDNLPKLGAELQAIADQSVQDAKADEGKIRELNEAVEVLQSEIKDLTAAIIALGIADAVAITLGVIATIAAWPVGAVTWFVLGPAVAVATAYIAIDAAKIKARKAEIEANQLAMDQITADVATLKILATNYQKMATESEQVQANLQTVLAAWQQLENDVTAAVTDVRTATADASAAAFEAVRNDINAAISAWGEAHSDASGLVIDLNVNNAPLTIGMSSTDVQAALAQGTSMDVIDYFNLVSSEAKAA